MFAKKQVFQILLLIISIAIFLPTQMSAKDGFNIKLKVKGVQDTTCYLAYHYGKQIYVKDTFQINHKGTSILKGDEKLTGGIYLIVLPEQRFFEFVIDTDEQQFSLETDTTDLIQNIKTSGSKANTLFIQHQKYVSKRQREINTLAKIKDTTESEDSLILIDEKIETLSKEMADYRLEIIAQHPESFVATILKAMQEPEAPESPRDEDGKEIDPLFRYKYVKKHFWDNIDFSDERLLHTPIIHNKLQRYLEKLTTKTADSINVACDVVIEKARANEKAFRYVVATLTNKYETSKIMGMDAIFVHLARNYYLTGDAYWVDSTSIAKVKERVLRLQHNLIGKTAKNITLVDTDGKKHALYDLDNEYVVMLFWDYNCGHCKKQMPGYIDFYNNYKAKDVGFYSVCTRIEKEKIVKYQEEKELPFPTLYDPENTSYFRAYYDVSSTPMSFLLDKDKKILAKKLGSKQLGEVLDRFMKAKEREVEEAQKNTEKEEKVQDKKSEKGKKRKGKKGRK